ncbi:hypothetical protein MNBD_BACTEROID02-579 [hydrothermal vent metagenome]|jgi:hypothetical protein|uniref:Uncharacterized protein n=1 Tax=hydrothermal vent metagenome TaxID=652676 RepID=A0A3B0R915_9ZZZZ
MKNINNFKGAIIEESLTNPDVLKKVSITKTDVYTVTERHKTPWVKKWTFHFVEVDENKAESIASEIGKNMDSEHVWYADFRNNKTHYVIYYNHVFKMDINKKEDYQKAIDYGSKLGLPNYQLDFSPHHKVS